MVWSWSCLVQYGAIDNHSLVLFFFIFCFMPKAPSHFIYWSLCFGSKHLHLHIFLVRLNWRSPTLNGRSTLLDTGNSLTSSAVNPSKQVLSLPGNYKTDGGRFKTCRLAQASSISPNVFHCCSLAPKTLWILLWSTCQCWGMKRQGRHQGSSAIYCAQALREQTTKRNLLGNEKWKKN